MGQYLLNGIVQATVALILVTILYGTGALVARFRGTALPTWSRWLGLYWPPHPQESLFFFGLFFAFGVVIAGLSVWFIPGYTTLAQKTPQAIIAASPLVTLLVAAPVYAFVTTGFSEELFFRGVLAKRLIGWLGFRWGNLIQALLFGLLHVGLVSLLGAPASGLLTYGLVGLSTGGLAWVAGWAMDARGAGSIVIPWLMHSAVNLATICFYVAVRILV